MGGSFRLFTEHVFEGSFYASPQRTTLNVRGKMPEGSTVQQLNEAVRKMENYISKFDEVEMFQTSITGYRNSSITINFKPEYEDGSFPFYLKEELTSKAINLGGLDWHVYGVGRGFSNELYTGYRNSNIILDGYNYDQLYEYAELLRKKLLEHPVCQRMSFAKHPVRTPAAGLCFDDPNSQNAHLNRLSGGAWVSLKFLQILLQPLERMLHE